jgi:AhpC/TSA family/Thiol:disulfide interchange protein DsbD, N-terminal
LRDSYARFDAHGIKLYAVSYDDQQSLREFSEAQGIPYPLLSDVDSTVIRQYGILNTEVSEDDLPFYGIPFPGTYICDETGTITSRFFHDSYKKRDSPEALIDAALGHIQIDDDAPQASGGEADIQITAAVRGGKGSIRQGIIRHLVVRFSLAEGLHIYGEPVPRGMIATTVTLQGHEGIRTLPAEYPPTKPLHLSALGVDLQVWSGEVDIVIPFYPTGELASESRPLETACTELNVEVHYQACNDQECLLPRTERFSLELALEVIDVPKLSVHTGHGQREGNYDSTPAMRRLMWRKLKKNPLGLPKFLWKSIKMQLAARRRLKKTA